MKMDKDKLKEAVEQFLTAWDTGRATSITTAITRLKDANKPTKQEVANHLRDVIGKGYGAIDEDEWLENAIDFLEEGLEV